MAKNLPDRRGPGHQRHQGGALHATGGWSPRPAPTCRCTTRARGWWSRRTTTSTPPRRRRCAAASRESGIDPRQVAAIAFDSQMAGIGSVDEDFRPATRFDSWLDMRCQPYIDVHGRALRRAHHPPDRLPADLRPRAEDPVVEARAARGVRRASPNSSRPAGYVAGRMAGLSGEQAFMDYTFIHFSGFATRERGAWSEELCALFGVDMGKLPEIVEPWQRDRRGESAGRARDFGLAAARPSPPGRATRPPMRWARASCGRGWSSTWPGTAAVLAGCTDHFVADVQAPRPADHALGHPRAVEPAGLHRRRRAGAALVPRPVLQRAARRSPAGGRGWPVRRR